MFIILLFLPMYDSNQLELQLINRLTLTMLITTE